MDTVLAWAGGNESDQEADTRELARRFDVRVEGCASWPHDSSCPMKACITAAAL